LKLEYFQMIDRVASLEGEAIVVESTIPEASPVFEGHFPGYPLMPGVLLVETMAQASGWLLLSLMRFERMPFLMGVKEAKFRSFVGPGTPVTVHAQRLHDGSGYAVTKARIEAAGKRICDAELTLRIMDFPAPELAAAMRGRGQELGLA
jgi:3-hydroxyacyl-[acyl-carrier-protein] dehydratase